jgi:rfaE bifunctional protein kinase chain/domain
MDRSDLERLLGDIAAVRIAVLGDYCLDAYWFLDPAGAELSLETSLPTHAVRTQRYSLGGAGNVVMNLRAMGVRHVAAFGVIGADPFGQHMLNLLREQHVNAAGMLRQREQWDTHVYAKPYLHDAEQHRVDFGNFNALSDEIAHALVHALRTRLSDFDAVIINEQVASGMHRSPTFQRLLASLIADYPAMLFVLDSRHCSDRYPGTIRKLNDHEAARLCGGTRDYDEPFRHDEACALAETLGQRWGSPVFVTCGARGCLVYDAHRLHVVPGLRISGPTDPVGAGDSMVAGITAALAAGRDTLAAATLGNFAAGVTVQKLFQTGTPSPEEILAIAENANYVYPPDLSGDAG